jgi:hypothetical protein
MVNCTVTKAGKGWSVSPPEVGIDSFFLLSIIDNPIEGIFFSPIIKSPIFS